MMDIKDLDTMILISIPSVIIKIKIHVYISSKYSLKISI